MLLLNLLFFVLACLVLVASGTALVRSLAKIALFLRLTEFAAAFIIMAIATSMPELFVGISSALAKNTALSLGNIIGANILDITLIVGIFTLLGRGIAIKSRTIKKDVLYMVGIALLPLILFLIDGAIDRIDGIILVLTFVLYSRRLLKRRKKFEKIYEEKNHIRRLDVVLTVLLFVASLVVLFVSANFVIKYATALSAALKLPAIMIGLFLISLGTTLPELTFGTRAVMLGHEEMAIGDQIGTITVNSTLVLGITALIHPITANFAPLFIAAVFLLLSAFLLATFIRSGKGLDITEGISLILLYIFFVVLEFYMKGFI